MGFFSFTNKREIYRIYTSHTLHRVALSFIGVYIPIFLLTLGFSLTKTIVFFIVYHSVGLLFALTVCPYLIKKLGLVHLIKLYYPIEICFFILLNFLPISQSLFWPIAIVGGLANFCYWIPINILLIKNAEKEKMGSDLAKFFAFPKIFGILGPLISAAFIPFIGFWPVFVLAIIGLVISYLPLMGIRNNKIDTTFNFQIKYIWKKLRERKSLFLLEGFDNIIEESEWFWGIFVFLIIGTLHAPGIVGSLNALGGAIFMVIVGKYTNKSVKVLIPIASACLIIVWLGRMFINDELPAYIITIIASFVMTLFLVPYFSMIYRSVKDQKEEEFLILREIPTVLGRIVVFSVILLTIANPRLFFMLPIFTTSALLIFFYLKRKKFTV